MKPALIRAAFWGLLCLSGVDAAGQVYRAVGYGEEEGLPSATVYDAAQGQDGRMWFAARGGVTVYDGREFRVFPVSEGLPASTYTHIRAAADGSFWTATNMGANLVSIYEDGRWRALPPAPFITLPEAMSDFEIIEGAEGVTAAVASRHEGVAVWRNGAWVHFDSRNGLADGEIQDISAHGGRLYVVCRNAVSIIEGGLARPAFQAPGLAELGDMFAVAVTPEAEGDGRVIWLMGDGWFGRFRQGRFEKLADLPPLDTELQPPFVLEPTPWGDLIMGNRSSLFHWDAAQKSLLPLGVANGLMAEGAHAVYFDRERNAWFPASRGLSKISSFRFANYYPDQGLLEDEVTAILETEPGHFVFGHDRGLTFHQAGGGFETLRFSNAGPQAHIFTRVMDLTQDRAGSVWIASGQQGVGKLGPDRDIQWFAEGLGDNTGVTSLLFDDNNRLWAGTLHSLVRWRNGRFEAVPIDSLGSVGVRNLAIDDQGRIYVCTGSDGLWTLHKGQWNAFVHPSDKQANSVYCAYRDHSGRVWVGARAGLFEARDGRLLPAAEELAARAVFFITEDDRNQMWLGTDNGLIRWDGRNLRQYGRRDGLAGVETNRAAGWFDSRGNLWVGANGGLSVYRADRDMTPIPKPLLQWRYFEANRNAYPLDQERRLSHSQNDLFFYFNCLSFIDEHRIEYQTKLENFDADWMAPARYEGRPVRYSNLPPGRYRLWARARNPGGEWSESQASSWFIIGKPYWRQAWFIALVLLAIGGLIYAAARYVHTRRNSLYLRGEVAAKTQALRQAMEAAQAANRAKSDFLATMSHEIRTPLNGVIAGMDILKRMGLKPEQQEYAEIVRLSGEALLNIVNDILDFSKIESGKLDLDCRPTSLIDMAQGALRIVELKAHEKQVELRFRVAPETPAVAVIDSARVQQILLNLVNNAIKFTQGGEVALSVGVASHAPLKLQFEVSDTGLGIPDEKLSHLFQPFYQVDSSTSRRFGGTGLGLAIVKRLVEAMGGEIRVHSEPGRGSTFQFTVAARMATPEEEARILEEKARESTAESPVASDGELRGMRVLVAEDNAINQKIAVRILQKEGVVVEVANDGREALEALERRVFDAILMDIQMPQMSGIEATERIVARWPPETRPFIIACTANALQEERERCLSVGMDDFLVKPLSIDEVHRTLKRWRAKANARQAS